MYPKRVKGQQTESCVKKQNGKHKAKNVSRKGNVWPRNNPDTYFLALYFLPVRIAINLTLGERIMAFVPVYGS